MARLLVMSSSSYVSSWSSYWCMAKALWWSTLLPLYIASSGTTIPIGTMSTSGSGSATVYVFVVLYLVRFSINILLPSIIYMLFMLRAHMHLYHVTNILFIIFYIKLILKLPKFLTMTSKLAKNHRCSHPGETCRGVHLIVGLPLVAQQTLPPIIIGLKDEHPLGRIEIRGKCVNK
jgi:hypothetical protein